MTWEKVTAVDFPASGAIHLANEVGKVCADALATRQIGGSGQRRVRVVHRREGRGGTVEHDPSATSPSRRPCRASAPGVREPVGHGDLRETALALIDAELADPSLDGVARSLERLCRALAQRLELLGVVARIAVPTDSGLTAVVAPPGASSALAELEVTAGEGPAATASLIRRPILLSDLSGAVSADWPGFRLLASEAGVAAVFAFPLHIGAAGFGTLELFARTAGVLSRADLSLVQAFAELATEALLDEGLTVPGGGLSPSLARAFDHHAEIAQAQGMVMVDLGVTLAEAMARLRAHAFAGGEPLLTLARRVVAGYIIPSDGDG